MKNYFPDKSADSLSHLINFGEPKDYPVNMSIAKRIAVLLFFGKGKLGMMSQAHDVRGA